MIELLAVPAGARLSLLGGITAEIIEKIDDEWVRLLTVPEEKGRPGDEELCHATDVREVL